ncbi:hypothetical protein N3K66_005184 [Trichothecium roseum]|uniref:Uncharacterized protein n=1 Tax=Trichothecium roseum TaxID=47278 RepID=A0ACC0V3G8_9HYPO|nr:hypothetical protein N3K66_005184 [Trichothecium roseum]
MTSLFMGTPNFTQAVIGPDLPHRLSLVSTLAELSLPKALGLLIICAWLVSLAVNAKKLPDAPVSGHKSAYEPSWFLQARFHEHAREIVREAYKKVKDSPFVLRRWDIDYLVLPIRYLEEIKRVPQSKLSIIGVLTSNLAPEHNEMGFLSWSLLHIESLKRKLIPELYKFVDMANDEVTRNWKQDFPATDDWEHVRLELAVRNVISRASSRIFIGSPACRSQQWVSDQVSFTGDFYLTSIWIKMFPDWMSPVMTWLTPAKYRARAALRRSRAVIAKLMKDHESVKEKRAQGIEVEEEDTLLHWMLDHAQPNERGEGQMAARLGFLSFVSLFTTTLTTSHIIYDLCEYPEWFDVIRGEVDAIAQDLGPPGANPNVSTREWVNRLEKIDSLMIESQRMSPLLVVSPQRLGTEDIVLKDGLRIPAGTRFTFASSEHHLDPNIFDSPERFDPLRSYNRRLSAPDRRDQHRAGMTGADNLAFGHGLQACPGRRFAVAQVKMLIARLLYDFEFKLEEGQVRSKIAYSNETAYSNEQQTILIRKRRT